MSQHIVYYNNTGAHIYLNPTEKIFRGNGDIFFFHVINLDC